MRTYFFIILTVAFGMWACGPHVAQEGSVVMPDDLPEGFAGFYERFLSDSLYQMEHILFPLQGLPDKADSATIAANKFRWEMEDWKLHRPIPPNSDFAVQLRPITETMIQENIRHATGRYGMERRYAYLDDGWYLIYYAGLNSVE